MMRGENEDHGTKRYFHGHIRCLTTSEDAPTTFNLILLRAAQGHLEHAKALDPENVVANGFLEKVLFITRNQFRDCR